MEASFMKESNERQFVYFFRSNEELISDVLNVCATFKCNEKNFYFFLLQILKSCTIFMQFPIHLALSESDRSSIYDFISRINGFMAAIAC
jgi:hypothetical protein